MADSGSLIEALSKMRGQHTPTALAFQMDNPYATLASVGPAYAQRGADIASNLMQQRIRDTISGMIPEQRQHEIQMQILKQATPGPAQTAHIFAGQGIEGGELDATAELGNTFADTTAKQAGAAKDLSSTRYNINPVAQIIREAMGLDPGQAGQLPSVASAAAGNPGKYGTSETTELNAVPMYDSNGNFIGLGKRTIKNEQKGAGPNPNIDAQNNRVEVNPKIDNTVANIQGKSYNISPSTKPGKVIVTNPDTGVRAEMDRAYVEAMISGQASQ